MIFADKPFKVGEYIRVGTYEGTVEDITFRSTRLRTIENTIAQISNSEISNSTVVNFSKMEKRRYALNLGVVLDTDLNKIMELKVQILEYLNNHPNVIDDTANMFFGDVGTNEYKLNIFCYVNITNYIEYLELKEQLNLDIMNLIHTNKIELAYDTKTIEIKNSIK